MLEPKKTKFRFPFSSSYEGKVKGNKNITWGQFGLKVNKGSYITAAQIEAARKATNKFVKKNGDMIIKIFPHLIKTKKPIGVRMGCGKGARVGYVAVVREGTIIIEVSGLEKKKAYEALLAAKYKIPGKCECEVIELEKKEKSSKKNEKNYTTLRQDWI